MKLHSCENMENRQYKLSIITICFNNAAGLDATLNSTLGQQHDFCDFEQIVVDGGSSDSTMEIVQKYQDRLSWYCSEPDNGIYDAMNKGAAHARGEYLLFLNSGDVLKDNVLCKMFREQFSEDLVYADIDTRMPDGTIVTKIAPSLDELTPGWFLWDTLPHQSTLIRRSLHEELGGYDDTMKISAAPKFIFQALVIKHCSVRKLDSVFSVFDRSGVSSNITAKEAKLQEWTSFLEPFYGKRVVNAAMNWLRVKPIVDKGTIDFISRHPECVPKIKSSLRSVIMRLSLEKHDMPCFFKELTAVPLRWVKRILKRCIKV